MTDSRWNMLGKIAADLSRAYDPGDHNPPGRCDLQLVLDTLYAARIVVSGSPLTTSSINVTTLLGAVQRVLQGLSGDIQMCAEQARENANSYRNGVEVREGLLGLADELDGLRGGS
jgi:hypothetical protein